MVNSVGLPNTIFTELRPSSDVKVPDGSVMSVTVISAFVDGVSFTSRSLFNLIDAISVSSPVLSPNRVTRPLRMARTRSDWFLYTPSGNATGFGFALLESMSFPERMAYAVTAFASAAVVSGAAGGCACAETALPANARSRATSMRIEDISETSFSCRTGVGVVPQHQRMNALKFVHGSNTRHLNNLSVVPASIAGNRWV